MAALTECSPGLIHDGRKAQAEFIHHYSCFWRLEACPSTGMWAFKFWEETLDNEPLLKRLHYQGCNLDGSIKKERTFLFSCDKS